MSHLKFIRIVLTCLFAAFAMNMSAQKTVSGIVKDGNGDEIIGASVLEKGTANGTTTDLNGKFTLKVSGNNPLVISYVGMKKQEVSIAGKSSVNVVLEDEATNLNEVVAIGYGTMKKRDVTGAISTVKNDVITLTPTSNPMEALQGRVAGLDITKTSSKAGAGVSMLLRGNRSISEKGEPLFLIDGLPGDYSALNPNDIETIEVLKDASTTAVYGSTGSNGVVIITTKKGSAGKTNINFNAYLGFNGWSTLPKFSPDNYVNTVFEAAKWAGKDHPDESVWPQAFQDAYANGQTIDWADALLKTGFTQNYSLSLSSGTEKSQTYVSLNYSNEKGQYENDSYRLLSSSIRLNYDLSKWLSAGVHSQIGYHKKSDPYSKLENALRANPFGSLYNEDGSVKPYPVINDNKQVNLLLNNDESVYKNKSNGLKLYFQPYIKVSPFKGFTWESRASISLNYTNSNRFVGYHSYQFYDAAGTGAVDEKDLTKLAQYTNATISDSHSEAYQWENILTYNFDINKDHHFTVTGVTTWSDSKNESNSEYTDGITSNAYYWTNLGAAIGENKSLSSDYSMGKSMGLVGRINYSYAGKYLASVSVRHDGNSKLAKDVRWDTFPAFSLGWRISEEKFMEKTRGWLDNLKIRGGWGVTGAANIAPYSSWSILQQGKMALGGQTMTSYFFPATITNAALTWEKSYNTNIGIDASFLNGRIDLNADFYVTKTKDVIWDMTLPINNGGSSATTYFKTTGNLAETKNTGFELTLNTRNIVKKDFTWTSTLTFSTNKEKVVSLGEGAGNYVTNGDWTLHVGDAIKSYYDYKCIGVWQTDEAAKAACLGLLPGDLKLEIPNSEYLLDEQGNTILRKYYDEYDEQGQRKYNDFSADNTYTPNDATDKQILGHNTPSWQMGFQNTLTYKDFDLSIYLYTRQGQMMYYEPLAWYNPTGGNFPTYFDYWTPENGANDFPALNADRTWTEKDKIARCYVSGTFWKIKNITLGYTLPHNLCAKAGMSKLRVYATISNPFVWATDHLVKDYDPEMNGSLDFPLTRQLVFGVNLSF